MLQLKDAGQRLLDAGQEQGLLLCILSMVHGFSCWSREGTARDAVQALALGRRAVTLEPKLVSPRHALGLALLNAGDGRGVLAEAEEALRLGGPLILTAMLLALAGEWERGTAALRIHMAMVKQYPRGAHHVLSLDAYRRGDYAAALAEAEAIGTPSLAWDPLDRALALARLGRLAEARAPPAPCRPSCRTRRATCTPSPRG